MAFSECFFRCLYLVRSAFFPILRAIFEGVPGVVEGSLWSHLKAKKICFSANKKFFAYDLGNPLKNRPQKRLFSDPPISDFSNFDHFWPKCQKSGKKFWNFFRRFWAVFQPFLNFDFCLEKRPFFHFFGGFFGRRKKIFCSLERARHMIIFGTSFVPIRFTYAELWLRQILDEKRHQIEETPKLPDSENGQNFKIASQRFLDVVEGSFWSHFVGLKKFFKMRPKWTLYDP